MCGGVGGARGHRLDVMQIVADRDEVEALLQELSHAVSSEQKHAEGDVVLLRIRDLPRGRETARVGMQRSGCGV